jgi:chemotaxis protein MotB
MNSMTDTPPQSEHDNPNALDEGLMEIADFPANLAKSRFAARFVNVDRRSQSNSVFLVDDAIFSSNMPRPTHWSVAWSDLMMTMFILFLVMFVYQTANQEFLQKKNPEIIGGDTTEALQTLDSSGASFPFSPIHPGLPLMTAGKVKRVERVQEEIPTFDAKAPIDQSTPSQKKEEEFDPFATQSPETMAESPKAAVPVESDEKIPPRLAATAIPGPEEEVVSPLPLTTEQEPSPSADTFQEMYALSKDALENSDLDKFASIDIIPDKTMRIILTGDLLFDLGLSDLSGDARQSLQKVAAVIQHTPYMINIVGHTDNVPMKSYRYSSNWELSVSRASTVARYLIDEMGMDPNQFVVSGYSAYRPVLPNTTAENRAKNRRVEIIISKRLPPPVPATTENLN